MVSYRGPGLQRNIGLYPPGATGHRTHHGGTGQYQVAWDARPRMMDTYRLDLKAIEQSLRDVQREFPKINEILQSRRDSMTDAVLDNMLAGYTFIDRAVVDGVDL